MTLFTFTLDCLRPRRRLSTSAAWFCCVAGTLWLWACTQATPQVLPSGSAPIHHAAATGNTADVQRLMKGQLEQRGPYGWTPLHFAAIHNAPSTAEILIAGGSRVDAVDQIGMTPLHWAARKGHTRIVELLVRHRASTAARNSMGMTPLHEAVTAAIAKMLIQAGAKIHERDEDGMTALHTAPTREVAQYLIGIGARVGARAKDGRTPMDMAPVPVPRVD